MRISKLFIDQQVSDHPLTRSIQARLKAPVEIVQNARQVHAAVASAPDPIQSGKEILYLSRNQGAFFKPCPGTRDYICCDYQILHIGTFCHMDCSYCILQTYFHPPILEYFVNHEDLLAELDKILAQKRLLRIGTGEFTDSLIWSLWTDVTKLLIERFAKQEHAVLELKTKTTAIEQLQDLDHQRKTIAAWSLNTPKIIRSEERGTTSLAARLKAAARCEKWGYPLAFHFDPLILYDGCETAYTQVIERIFSQISAENIVWISLGSLRFVPSVKPVIQQRFPDSKIVYAEFVKGTDGKMRYFKPLRIDLYREIITCIRDYAPDVAVYLCMEDDEVWQKALGFIPGDVGGLPNMLDNSAVRLCNLKAGG
ncbi:MAG: DNA photolyase [Desulfobacterales bacterium]|nr:DNA photolyase [Desulfobacterales bacterium]